MRDLLLSRYNNIDHILSLPIEDGMELIEYAQEEKKKQKAWEMWLVQYQHMEKKNFVPFSEFYESLQVRISYRPAEDILREAEEISRACEVAKRGDI